jgi:nitrite reductase/ring-hydroxylating ferredoxin subunit
VDIGDKPVVLWRDAEGHARALEDRCPHRRAPLSLGCIRKEGWIQCGYHGWSYDGATGRVREIPNLKNEQRFSPVYRAERYAVHEAGGFVRISQNPEAVAPGNDLIDMPLSGTVHVALDHERYLAALFDDPGLLMSIIGVHFTTYLMSELHEQDGRLLMERSCQWKRPHWPAAFSSDYPLTLMSSTEPVTGETALLLRDRDFRDLLSVRLAPVPAGRGVTAVRWRAVRGPGLPSFVGRTLEWLNPIKVHATVDGAALRTLKPTASVVFDELRRRLHPLSAQSVA